MNSKINSTQGSGAEEPVQVFRQFAWHLAGSLAAAKSGGAGSRATARTAKPTRSGKR